MKLGTDVSSSGDRFEYPGSTSCELFPRPSGGFDKFFQHKREGFNREGTSAVGVGSTSGNLLRCSLEANVAKDGSSTACGEVPHGDDQCRDFWCDVPRAVWRLWPTEGHRADPVSGHDLLGLHDDRELGRGEGHGGSSGCDVGTGMFGLRPLRRRPGSHFARRCPGCNLHKPPSLPGVQGKSFRSFVRSALGHDCNCIPEGARHDHVKTDRASQPKGGQDGAAALGPKSKRSAQAETEGKRQRSGRSECSRRGRGLDDHPDTARALDLLDETASFDRWSICLPRWILSARTELAWHLLRSFSVSWKGQPWPSTAVYPLPVPFPGIFRSSGPGLCKKKLLAVARRRLVHVLVMVLNNPYLDRFPTLHELGRPPNDLQRGCFKRLMSFVMACGSRLEPCPVAPGRSGPELIADLDLLEKFAEKMCLADFGYAGGERLRMSQDRERRSEQLERYPQLRPYRQLDVDRLKITGTGEWPLEKYLQSELWLPYVEPRCLLHGMDTTSFPVPSFAGEDRQEYLKLARKWDSLGLLQLHPVPVMEGHFAKIFNTYKSPEHDRQIGDRRIANSREFAAGGPSRHLPTGPSLTALTVPRFTHVLRGALTDRRDFYHQAAVSEERCVSNMTPFAYAGSELHNLRAWEDHLRRVETNKKKTREEVGDHFESQGRAPDKIAGGDHLHPCFAALYQGDHLGVEFALEAHQNLLVDGGLLAQDRRLQGHSMIPTGPLWEGLIIDDFFVLGAVPIDAKKEDTDVFKLLVRARELYEKHRLPGLVEKDVVAEDLFKAAGWIYKELCHLH